MTAQVKFKILPKYPANTVGSKFVTITKANGIYTIDVDYTLLDATAIIDPTQALIAVLDESSGSYKTVTLSSLLSSGQFIEEPEHIVTTSSATIVASDGVVVIERTNPATTALALPTVASRAGRVLRIIDWSTSVSSHTITITPSGSEKIMKGATLTLLSTADQLGSVTLVPSTTLSGWYIAP